MQSSLIVNKYNYEFRLNTGLNRSQESTPSEHLRWNLRSLSRRLHLLWRKSRGRGGWPWSSLPLATSRYAPYCRHQIPSSEGILERKPMRRRSGDDYLFSADALITAEFLAKLADNFAMKSRRRGREFKSTLLHHPVSRFPDIAVNRSKSARPRAIRARRLGVLKRLIIERGGRSLLPGRKQTRAARFSIRMPHGLA